VYVCKKSCCVTYKKNLMKLKVPHKIQRCLAKNIGWGSYKGGSGIQPFSQATKAGLVTQILEARSVFLSSHCGCFWESNFEPPCFGFQHCVFYIYPERISVFASKTMMMDDEAKGTVK